MVLQHLNQEQVDLLGVSLQKRNEANFALGNIASMLSGIPGLRGAWIASSFDENGDIFDISEQGRDVSYNGTPEFDYSALIPYATFDGVNDYFERLDEAGLDITGTETYVASAKRGLTIGGWFYFENTPTFQLMTKALFLNDLSYYLWINAGVPQLTISSGGSAITATSVISTETAAQNTWYFIVGSYDPSTEMNIYINNTKTQLAAGVPASIFSGAADFQIGGLDGAATNRLEGRFSFGFLSAMFLSDTIIGNLWQQSRSLFGV